MKRVLLPPFGIMQFDASRAQGKVIIQRHQSLAMVTLHGWASVFAYVEEHCFSGKDNCPHGSADSVMTFDIKLNSRDEKNNFCNKLHYLTDAECDR